MYICVYGSLRPGCYNYKRFLSYYPGEISHIASEVLEGYDLYSLGAYPGIKGGKGKLKVDILKVSDAVYNSIDDMELGAGYSRKEIEVLGNKCTIYLYNGEVDELVENGDWLEYNKITL